MRIGAEFVASFPRRVETLGLLVRVCRRDFVFVRGRFIPVFRF